MRSDESGVKNVMKHRRRDAPVLEDEDLSARWREVLKSYSAADEGQQRGTIYPRQQRLFDIVRKDGRIRLMLGYGEENPDPDFANHGQRRQVECLLGFERPVGHLMEEAEERWMTGDFQGEAAILEEFANSNPQRDAILDLAAEARQDALTGASTRQKPRRRGME